MFNDLFVTIAAGMIGALPIQPTPAVVVQVDDIKSSVVQYIETSENRKVALDCIISESKIAVKESHPMEFICLTTDTTNKQKFKTTVTLVAHDGKVSISASLSGNDKTPKVVSPAPSPTSDSKEK